MRNIKSVYKSLFRRVQHILKTRKNHKDRRRLSNPDVTIIANHCMGGFMYHDLGLQFQSPTINLKIIPDEFIELVEHLDYYLKQDILPCTDTTEKYPVGKIPFIDGKGFIHLYFVHYKTFEQAIAKWKERISRMNWTDIVVFMTARDGCKEETLQRFERLPYKQRICYTNDPHPEYPHTKHARLDNGKPLVGYISDMINISGKRAYECNGFDYVGFINGIDQLPYK